MKEDSKWFSKIQEEFDLENEEVLEVKNCLDRLSKDFDSGNAENFNLDGGSLHNLGIYKMRVRGLLLTVGFYQEVTGKKLNLTKKEVLYLSIVREKSRRSMAGFLKDSESLPVQEDEIKLHKGDHANPGSRASGSPGRPQKLYRVEEWSSLDASEDTIAQPFIKVLNEYVEFEEEDEESFEEFQQFIDLFIQFSSHYILRPIRSTIIYLIDRREAIEEDRIETFERSEGTFPKRVEFNPGRIFSDLESEKRSLRLNLDEESVEILSGWQLDPDQAPYLFRKNSDRLYEFAILVATAIDFFECLNRDLDESAKGEINSYFSQKDYL